MKEKKYKCIHCKSTNVKSNGEKQFYCKDCKKYFKEGSIRKEYSKPIELLILAFQRLIYPGDKFRNAKPFSIKEFYKVIKTGKVLNFHNPCIEYIRPNQSVDATSGQIAIIARTDSGFTVVRGLKRGDSISLSDCIIKMH